MFEAPKDRPPYVTFEMKPVEVRSANPAEPSTYKDVDYAYITPIGSKDRIERNVLEWFEQCEQMCQNDRFQRAWLLEFKASYAAWKAGQEPPVNGSAIRSWPVLSPAQVKTLLQLKVQTVEDLAAANEETLARIGMGGRALKDQAKTWLASQDKTGLATLVKQVEGLTLAMEDLKARNELLEKGNADLKAELARAQPATV